MAEAEPVRPIMPDADGNATSPGSAADDASPGRRRMDRQTALMEADRLMMMIVQTSISLIGFGFTINAFFNGVSFRGVGVDADVVARRLGLAMLCLGLLFLSMGVWNQAMYRRALARRYHDLPSDETSAYSAAASMTVAALLLLIGFVALGSALLRAAY